MDAMFSRLLFLTIIILSSFAGSCSAEKAQALFVFGDSFVDTGNRNPYIQSENDPWRPPYGFTWPGFPAGRFSSGEIQTDFWGKLTILPLSTNADILGLPVPVAYQQLKSHECKESAKKIRKGVNFGVGGSGIFEAYGFITLAEQVKQFKELIAASPEFDSHNLSRSVILICIVGNDYTFLASENGSIQGMMDLVKPVVSGTIDAVRDLYASGLRNFAVSNIARFGCKPQIGRTSCDSNYNDLLALHTRLLRESVENLKSDLKESSIIIPDFASSFNHIFSNPAQFGFVDLYVPCSGMKGGVEMCGEVDEAGRALYQVCSNVDERFFWDEYHPTERGWYAIMSLYINGAAEEGNKTISFIEGAQNILERVESLGFAAYNISTHLNKLCISNSLSFK